MPDFSSSPSLIAGRLSLDFVNVLGSALRFFLGRPSPISSWLLESSLQNEAPNCSLSHKMTLKAPPPSSAEPKLCMPLCAKSSPPCSPKKPCSATGSRRSMRYLRITEGHDELLEQDGKWGLEFVAREGGLDWLLAAIARSAAEIIAEGTSSRLRACANPSCRLFFYDTSRTRRRRWCSMSRCGNRHKVAVFSRRHSLSRRTH